MRITYISIVLLFLFKSSYTQNLSGRWYGKLTQEAGGFKDSYDFELDIAHRKNIWGESFVFYKDSIAIKIGFSGYIKGDSLYISERENLIFQEKVPNNWIACVKNITLGYHRYFENEFLLGRWTGASVLDGTTCIPGMVILARSHSALEDYLEELIIKKNLASKTRSKSISIKPSSPLNFDESFKNTLPRKITEIVVNSTDLQFELVDYMKEDNDTVSVYLNRQPILQNVKISNQPAFVYFHIDPKFQLHELLLYAENLGNVKPNTSQLTIFDGDKTFRLMIESDKQKTAAVYLRYEPL
ncbi:MAG: hypothetical protein JWN56_1445 [Sphingobacteriales bacterium]|nr:hypothetical protein [Sphingobacteriales bacterium]